MGSEIDRERERKSARASVCPLFRSLTRAIGRGEYKTECPSFFTRARACVMYVL
jgi:hypothetical protein